MLSRCGDRVVVHRCSVCSQRLKHGGDTLIVKVRLQNPRFISIVVVVVVRSMCALFELTRNLIGSTWVLSTLRMMLSMGGSV